MKLHCQKGFNLILFSYRLDLLEGELGFAHSFEELL